MPPAWRRTRSPTRNGRALSSTIPAMRLPSVCCAARPMITAVKAPPHGQRAGLEARDVERGEDDDADEEEPDQEPDRARCRGVHPPEQGRPERLAHVAGGGPAECHEGDDGGDPDRLVEPEDVLAVVVEDQHAGEQREQHDQLEPRALGGAPRQLAREPHLLPGVALGLEHLREALVVSDLLDSWHRSAALPRLAFSTNRIIRLAHERRDERLLAGERLARGGGDLHRHQLAGAPEAVEVDDLVVARPSSELSRVGPRRAPRRGRRACGRRSAGRARARGAGRPRPAAPCARS